MQKSKYIKKNRCALFIYVLIHYYENVYLLHYRCQDATV